MRFREILTLLHREGWKVGKYLVYRLYKEEGLTLRQRLRRRHRAAVHARESDGSRPDRTQCGVWTSWRISGLTDDGFEP
jgi:hypothetical protein